MRADRRWSFSHLQLIAYFDLQNVTGARNVSNIYWDPRAQRVLRDQSFGLLPSIGINLQF